MNPGPAEEIGKATNSFFRIMQSEPLSLALCVMNVLLLALFFYVIRTATDVRKAEMDRVFTAQEKTNELLFNCVPSQQRGDFAAPRELLKAH